MSSRHCPEPQTWFTQNNVFFTVLSRFESCSSPVKLIWLFPECEHYISLFIVRFLPKIMVIPNFHAQPARQNLSPDIFFTSNNLTPFFHSLFNLFFLNDQIINNTFSIFEYSHNCIFVIFPHFVPSTPYIDFYSPSLPSL